MEKSQVPLRLISWPADEHVPNRKPSQPMLGTSPDKRCNHTHPLCSLLSRREIPGRNYVMIKSSHWLSDVTHCLSCCQLVLPKPHAFCSKNVQSLLANEFYWISHEEKESPCRETMRPATQKMYGILILQMLSHSSYISQLCMMSISAKHAQIVPTYSNEITEPTKGGVEWWHAIYLKYRISNMIASKKSVSIAWSCGSWKTWLRCCTHMASESMIIGT